MPASDEQKRAQIFRQHTQTMKKHHGLSFDIHTKQIKENIKIFKQQLKQACDSHNTLMIESYRDKLFHSLAEQHILTIKKVGETYSTIPPYMYNNMLKTYIRQCMLVDTYITSRQ